MGTKKTKDTFINEAINVHGNRYDYSKVVYVNSTQKVCIICPKHGEFLQTPNSHLHGHGCPKCSGVSKMTYEEFLSKANDIHKHKFIYNNDFDGIHKKITITCPTHGNFIQLAKKHLQGQSCPKCAIEKLSTNKKDRNKLFINQSNIRFNNLYLFPNIDNEYINSHSKLTVVCDKCNNTFTKIACDHLTSPFGGCKYCYGNTSKSENEIIDYIKSSFPSLKLSLNDRTLLNGKEIDILIPQLKIGIEFNGLYWHSEEVHSDKNYHLNKTNMCEEKGYQLIQIFEDEFIYSKNIVLSKIKHILGMDYGKKIMARKCNVKEITYKEAKDFLLINHIQGFAKATTYVGCFYKNELIAVMTFVKTNINEWELNRFATDNNFNCIGVGGKLFKYFTRNYNPSSIKSFADRRWSTLLHDNLYTKIGFEIDKITRPDYYYLIKGTNKRIHKFNFRKQILHKKYSFPISDTETDMANKLNACKIWNCGLIKYIWKNDNK